MRIMNYKTTFEAEKSTLLLIQKVKAEDYNIVILWDSGSSISLIKRDYAYSCKLSGINVSYELVTLGNIAAKLQNTVLFDSNGNKHLIKAYAIEEICHGYENIDIRGVVGLFKNLR